MLQPAHSERFSVYLVQDYQSFSQRVAIVKVVLCVCFLFPLLQNKYLPAQLLLDQFLGFILCGGVVRQMLTITDKGG